MLGRDSEALALEKETSSLDPLDLWSKIEVVQNSKCGVETTSIRALRDKFPKAEYFLDVAINYVDAGIYDDAFAVLDVMKEISGDSTNPMICYYTGYFYHQLGEVSKAKEFYELAERMSSDYCFPSRLESIAVLEDAKELNPEGAKASYYLGNLFYDKSRYDDAMANWEKSRALDDSFHIVHRNLAIVYFDKKNNAVAAKAAMEKAFALCPTDSRLLYELQQLYKNMGVQPQERLKRYEDCGDLAAERDDCSIDKIVLFTQLGKYDQAEALLSSRRFNAFEGGEGRIISAHS
jgi:tetratricopeptide (TPR) repeat protein